MKNKDKNNPEQGPLTEPMDIGTEEFEDFQQFILSKAQSRTKSQKVLVEQASLKFQMEDYLNSNSEKVLSLGQFLKSFLEKAGIKQKQFAYYIGLRPSNFSKLLSGERKVNVEIALILESILNISAQTILSIQTYNELKALPDSKKKELSRYNIDALLE